MQLLHLHTPTQVDRHFLKSSNLEQTIFSCSELLEKVWGGFPGCGLGVRILELWLELAVVDSGLCYCTSRALFVLVLKTNRLDYSAAFAFASPSGRSSLRSLSLDCATAPPELYIYIFVLAPKTNLYGYSPPSKP